MKLRWRILATAPIFVAMFGCTLEDGPALTVPADAAAIDNLL